MRFVVQMSKFPDQKVMVYREYWQINQVKECIISYRFLLIKAKLIELTQRNKNQKIYILMTLPHTSNANISLLCKYNQQ